MNERMTKSQVQGWVYDVRRRSMKVKAELG